MKNYDYSRLIKSITIGIILFFIASGVAATFWVIKPFWLDEWFIVYNLKYKTSEELWGKLDFLQQFPRVYLQIIKKFSSEFNYSYTSLRLPSFLVHSFAVLLIYRLSGRIFKTERLHRFLWVLLYVSFRTSLEYYVQTKQYTMDMLLGVVGLWQVIELFGEQENKSGKNYVLLCISLVIAPFFSYTYPIVFAPVYAILFIRFILSKNSLNPKLILPVILGTLSIVVFYIVDVSQVMNDSEMYNYWDELLLNKQFSLKSFFLNLYSMFQNMGAGDLFENIFGVLGIVSLAYATYQSIKNIRKTNNLENTLKLYTSLLLWLVFALYAAGKLPVGSHRLNAFVTPALALIIMYLLIDLQKSTKKGIKYFSIGLSVVLFFAVIGNIIPSTLFHIFEDDVPKKMVIYKNTEAAIIAAQTKNLPILATPSVAYPWHDQIKGDWVLKTHPAYNISTNLAVYDVPDSTTTIPPQLGNIKSAVLVKAESYTILTRY